MARAPVLTLCQTAGPSRRADDFARGLLALGLRPRDRAVLWMPNCVEWNVANLGLAKIGAVTVTCNSRYKAFEVDCVLRQSDARALIRTRRAEGRRSRDGGARSDSGCGPDVLVHGHPVLAGPLGRVEGLIGRPDQLVSGGGHVLRQRRDAEAGGHPATV